MSRKPESGKKTPKTAKTPPRYEPPKLTRFEKLERLIVAGE